MYELLAANYDRYYKALYYTATSTFIQHSIPLSPDDQLIDVGGGTGQLALMIKSDIKMEKPIVCVEPAKAMCEVASKREGVIAINKTAEEFFSSKPDYPLKVVLINNCVHFLNADLVFSGLVKYLPEDGICMVTLLAFDDTFPLFEKARNDTVAVGKLRKSSHYPSLIESRGLKCKVVESSGHVRLEKALWYEAIRNKFMSHLAKYSEEELEEGITELETCYKDVDVIEFNLPIVGLIVTK